ncbi:single-stranded DNA-binding protein [Brachyspira hampsonii]|uniref:Single-stranded DNA-binding protein n=4 Tax=Brachyspira hampsonii TaxID=1287055 RepID=A0AAC9XKD1_9SPIR|nr:single-stranded DNA-binding protein [Brachyspira hampsonii]ASJ21555.1 single-stranded DNA-binding protein [Brachyspira hampsonii]
MADHNIVTLIGRLTADPQRKYTQGGMEIAEFSIANNYYVITKNTTEVNYFDIVAFGKLAETVSKYLIKGKQVLICGTLRQERWQDKNTNTTKSKVRIIMQSMQMLADKKEADNNVSQTNNQEYDEEVPF